MRAAGAPRAIYTLIACAKLNDIDPQAWFADIWPICRVIPPSASRHFCLGIGALRASPVQLEPIRSPTKMS